ncbi:unnamed protein product, partial [Arabidopsis halleri]
TWRPFKFVILFPPFFLNIWRFCIKAFNPPDPKPQHVILVSSQTSHKPATS